MSEPIPDVVAATALVGLIKLLHTDPLARPLLGDQPDSPWYRVADGELSLRYMNPDKGSEQLASAKALFGGTVSVEAASYSTTREDHVLATTWHGVPLEVKVEIRREDELAELRKQLGHLRAAQTAAYAGQDVAE